MRRLVNHKKSHGIIARHFTLNEQVTSMDEHGHQHAESHHPPIVLVALAAIMLITLGVIGRLNAPAIQAQANPNEETVEARVITVLDEGVNTQGGIQQPYQRLRLEILTGSRAGRAVDIDYGTQGFVSSSILYKTDDRVQVSQIIRPDGGEVYYITEPDRLGALIALLVLFIVVILAVSRWKGLRSLLGMAISFYVITQFILPLILAGRDPVLVSVIGAFGLLAVTQYLIYGWSLKTHAAVLGILISLVITGGLASIFVDAARLSGFGAEEVSFLQVAAGSINPRGLLLAGILIGAIGVLDDLTISQASSVFELSRANRALGLRDLYRRAMNIGQDHIASTVNTLVLAYVGASLPLLLLFAVYPQPFGQIVNREFVTEEVVRTLVGSLGLVSAVPITTLLACVLVGMPVSRRKVISDAA
jgi:uncharacterized membrane protein